MLCFCSDYNEVITPAIKPGQFIRRSLLLLLYRLRLCRFFYALDWRRVGRPLDLLLLNEAGAETADRNGQDEGSTMPKQYPSLTGRRDHRLVRQETGVGLKLAR